MKWKCDICYQSKPCILEDNEPVVEDTPNTCPYGFESAEWELIEEDD